MPVGGRGQGWVPCGCSAVGVWLRCCDLIHAQKMTAGEGEGIMHTELHFMQKAIGLKSLLGNKNSTYVVFATAVNKQRDGDLKPAALGASCSKHLWVTK